MQSNLPRFLPTEGPAPLQSCQLSYPASHELKPGHCWGRSPAPGGSFLLTGWPPAWWRGAGGTEREGGPLWLVLFQERPRWRGLPDGIKGSLREESTLHSSFSGQRLKRYRGKVKLCCSFAPLEINSPFKGVTQLTPPWNLGVHQDSNLLSNDIKNALYKGPVSSSHPQAFFFFFPAKS